MAGLLTAQRLLEVINYDQDTGVFTWKVRLSCRAAAGSLAGAWHKDGRLYICIDKKQHLAHRLAWMYIHGTFPEDCIDHINGNKSDNRLCNLRPATHAENMQNHRKARSDSASKLIGAMPRKRQSRGWYSEIRSNGKKIHLGSFFTKEEAHLAYVKAKRELHAFCTI